MPFSEATPYSVLCLVGRVEDILDTCLHVDHTLPGVLPRVLFDAYVYYCCSSLLPIFMIAYKNYLLHDLPRHTNFQSKLLEN